MGFWDRPRDVWFRRALFQVHLWCGLILGLYFVVVCLTGTIVVYKKELERLAIPELVHVQATGPRGSFAEMVRLVKERYPDQRLVNAYLYQEPGVSWSFRIQGTEDCRDRRTPARPVSRQPRPCRRGERLLSDTDPDSRAAAT